MTAKQLFLSVRLQLGDVSGLKYNNYLLMPVLNDVLYMFNRALAYTENYTVRKKANLTFTNQEATIPTDYNGIVSLLNAGTEVNPNNFYFLGDKIVLKPNITATDIVYNYLYPVLTTENDNLPVPENLTHLVRKYVKGVISKELPESQVYQSILQEVSNIVGGKEYTYIERELPWEV